jgi:hypothetical protein
MTKEEEKNTLATEVESWKGFEYALRNPNTVLFSKMLSECLENKDYVTALRTKGPQYSAESLFMVLIFEQQKTISKLIEAMESIQNRKNEGSTLFSGKINLI